MKLEDLAPIPVRPTRMPDGSTYFYAAQAAALEQRLAYAKELLNDAYPCLIPSDLVKPSIKAFIEKLNSENL